MTTQRNLWEAKRDVELTLERDYPVKQYLQAQTAEHMAAITKGLAMLVQWPTWDYERRCKVVARLKYLLDELLNATSNLYRPLPQTTVIACPGCERITLPSFHNCYACQCGRLWHHHRASNFRPLPAGFWSKAMPGGPIKKSLLSEEQRTTETDVA